MVQVVVFLRSETFTDVPRKLQLGGGIGPGYKILGGWDFIGLNSSM